MQAVPDNHVVAAVAAVDHQFVLDAVVHHWFAHASRRVAVVNRAVVVSKHVVNHRVVSRPAAPNNHVANHRIVVLDGKDDRWHY